MTGNLGTGGWGSCVARASAEMCWACPVFWQLIVGHLQLVLLLAANDAGEESLMRNMDQFIFKFMK